MTQSNGEGGVTAESEGIATVPGAKSAPSPPETSAQKIPWRIPKLSLPTKLAAMLLLTSLASAAIVAALGYLDGKEQLRQQALDQLSSIKSAKKQQVEWYFRQMRETFKSFGEDVTVVSAVSAFKDGFAQLGRQGLTPERRQLLNKYYINEYIDDLTQSGEMPDMTALLPKTDRALEFQTLFIAENPNSKGERGKLADHPASNAYTLTHYTFHPWFRDVVARYNFQDLFLIDGVSGDIVYSVAKEPEIGTSLLDGPYASSRLGKLVKAIIASPQRGTVFLADTSLYQPSGNIPAMFIATPIFANWKFMGVMAAQVSSESLAAFMTNGGRWREDGLGETGEIYLAAEDRLMRSDSRGLLENKDTFLKGLEATDMPRTEIGRMARLNTTQLLQSVNTEAVRQALQGTEGLAEYENYHGRDVLGAFAPLDIPDLNWVLVAEKDMEEILAPQTSFARQVMLVTLLLALAVPLLATLLAKRFLKPVNTLLAGIDRFKAGDADAAIATGGDDEFGRLATAFNGMSAAVRERDQTIQRKSTAYEALLRHIFPDAIAQRMKDGEGQIVETFPQTAVVFASVLGFIKAMDGKDGKDSIGLLNEIVDTFDVAAEECGVEKIKTIGEHYLAACGLSTPRLDHVQRATEFADRIALEVERINRTRSLDLKLRIAIDSGLVHAGLVGNRRFVYDIWGRPLNLARRIVLDTDRGEVRLSERAHKSIDQPAEFKERPAFESKELGTIKSFGRPLATAERTAKGASPKAAE